MIIAVASGKGGTGKTTLATSLALSLASVGGDNGRPLFLDCDVEEPNAALFLRPAIHHREEVGILIPKVDHNLCDYCGRCSDVCVWHAIAVAGRNVLVFPELCHGCGSCAINCPQGAIREELYVLGTLESGPAEGFDYAQGRMNVGHAMGVPIIRQLKKKFIGNNSHRGATQPVILDSPPGTSCPAVETMRGTDYVLLVTEPTPFGLHDLRLAVQVARDELGIKVGVIVNRDGLGDTRVDAYCAGEGLPILMRIPHSREIAVAISDGQPLVVARPEYMPRFIEIYRRIQAGAGA